MESERLVFLSSRPRKWNMSLSVCVARGSSSQSISVQSSWFLHGQHLLTSGLPLGQYVVVKLFFSIFVRFMFLHDHWLWTVRVLFSFLLPEINRAVLFQCCSGCRWRRQLQPWPGGDLLPKPNHPSPGQDRPTEGLSPLSGVCEGAVSQHDGEGGRQAPESC